MNLHRRKVNSFRKKIEIFVRFPQECLLDQVVKLIASERRLKSLNYYLKHNFLLNRRKVNSFRKKIEIVPFDQKDIEIDIRRKVNSFRKKIEIT